LEAEKLAALAALNGAPDYPVKKIERLWNLMALAQFHDSITSSHTDFAYDEIVNINQDIKLGAAQIYEKASKYLTSSEDGTFTALNTYNFELNTIFTAVFTSEEEWENAVVTDEKGEKLPVLSVVGYNMVEKMRGMEHSRHSVTVKFRASVPANGALTVKISNAPAEAERISDTFENEFYKIELDKYGICSIFDKQLNKQVGKDCGRFNIGEDNGSAWETLAHPHHSTNLRKYARVTGVFADKSKSWVTIEGEYDENENLYIGKPYVTNIVKWKQTVTLTKGLKRVDFKTEVDFDTHSRQLKIVFPTTNRTNEAIYAIPYGNFRKMPYEPQYGKHSLPNGEYAVIGHTSIEGDGFTAALINKGTPSHRVSNGTINNVILRSPEIPLSNFGCKGALDKGVHIFEHAFYSAAGNFEKTDIQRVADAFNTPTLCLSGSVSLAKNIKVEGETIVLSSFKKGEDNGYILRLVETNGVDCACNVTFDGAVVAYECDLLENELKELQMQGGKIELALKPFEIYTLKVVV